MNNKRNDENSGKISYGRFEILSNNIPHKVGSKKLNKSVINKCENLQEVTLDKLQENISDCSVNDDCTNKEDIIANNGCENNKEEDKHNKKSNFVSRGSSEKDRKYLHVHKNRDNLNNYNFKDRNFRDRDIVKNKNSMENNGSDNIEYQANSSGKNNKRNKFNYAVNPEILKQKELNKLHKYKFNSLSNGNVENNSTMYVRTHVAHYFQIEKLLIDALEEAKSKPEIFGENFDSDFKINHVLNHDLTYIGYVFIDVSNPKFYYALTGSLLDGSPNVIYKDDSDWIPGEYDGSWGSEMDIMSPPKIEVRLPPLLSLKEYEYDDMQKSHMQKAHMGKDQETGMVTISPAFVTVKNTDGFSSTQLYVSDVPANDINFLMSLFARYARSYTKDNFPKINIREKDNKEGQYFATVKYYSEYDAAFALIMSKRIRVKYNDVNVVMSVRYALNR